MFRIQVTGVQEVINKINSKLGQAFFDRAMHHVMIQARNISKNQLCPVDTGMLRDSIYIRKESEGVYEMGFTVYYGVWHEFGSYNIHEGTVEAPNLIKTGYSPFLRPALWRTIKNFPHIVNQVWTEV